MELSSEQVGWITKHIRAAVHITCRRYNIVKDQHGEDMEQECWVEVLRIKDRYDPTRGKLSTFLYLSIFRRCARFAQQVQRRNATWIELDERLHVEDTDDAINALQRLSEVDATVIAAVMGFSDEEIGELFGMDKRTVTKQRRAAQREMNL